MLNTNNKFNKISRRKKTSKIMTQPESVLVEAKIMLKIGTHTRFFFRSEESYEFFAENHEPKLNILGDRTIIRR